MEDRVGGCLFLAGLSFSSVAMLGSHVFGWFAALELELSPAF